jgi:hypothetical protein
LTDPEDDSVADWGGAKVSQNVEWPLPPSPISQLMFPEGDRKPACPGPFMNRLLAGYDEVVVLGGERRRRAAGSGQNQQTGRETEGKTTLHPHGADPLNHAHRLPLDAACLPDILPNQALDTVPRRAIEIRGKIT